MKLLVCVMSYYFVLENLQGQNIEKNKTPLKSEVLRGFKLVEKMGVEPLISHQ